MKGSHHVISLSVTKKRFNDFQKNVLEEYKSLRVLNVVESRRPRTKDNEFRRKSSGKHFNIESARLRLK